MIATKVISAGAPFEYRYALDAAMSILGRESLPVVLCNVSEVSHEIPRRLPFWSASRPAGAALWVEPLLETWAADLNSLNEALPNGGRLVVIASRPLVLLLPGRPIWSGRPLGIWPGGIGRIRRLLAGADFRLEASYGLHQPVAIGLNLLGETMDRCGRPDLADHLRFAARLQYCATGPLASLSTVGLLIGRKERR
jgi:hypothetical protein